MPLLLRPPGNSESLGEVLGELGRFRKRVAVAAGLFAVVAIATGGVVLTGLGDVAFDLPPLARGLALVGTLTATGVCWLRAVAPALALRTDPLAVALELENRHPDLNDALASAVDFETAEAAGRPGSSPRLQELVLRQARRLADRHDFDSLAPTGRCWRNAWLSVLTLAVVVGAAVAGGDRARTALIRFLDPFGHHPWPTRTRVEILRPHPLPARVPKGEAFELEFVVRGVVPDRAVVAFRVLGGEEFTEEYPLVVGNDPQFPLAAVVTARLDPARLPTTFHFRIRCNDYEGDWQPVVVVPPPRLVPVDGRPSPQFHVTPPAYTGLPPHDLPDGTAVLEVPVGTVVRLRAGTDVRLTAAVLAFTGDRPVVDLASALAVVGHLNPLAAAATPQLAAAVGGDLPLTLDPSGTILTGTVMPSMSGMYALRLTDETGLTGTRLIEIRLIPDPVPTVTLLRPAPGQDPFVLSPSAVIPCHVAADDRTYAVRDTFLEYRVGRDGAPRRIGLTSADEVRAALAAVTGGAGVVAPVRPRTTEARATLPLSTFSREDGTPLRDGDRLLIRAAADDWDDVSPAKPPGYSAVVELVIASPESVEAWVQRELAALRPELLRLRDQQREARLKASEVLPEVDGTLTPADRDKLLATEQTQRQVRGRLADPTDGLKARAELLRETVRANDLTRSPVAERVEIVARELGRLVDYDLPVIEPALSDARQLGSRPPQPTPDRAVAERIRKGTRHQKAVEDTLGDLYDLLSVWGAAGDVRGEARALRDLIVRQAEEWDQVERPAPAADRDRAAARAEQAADQANQLIGRAIRLAAEQEARATQARAAAEARAQEAVRLRGEAESLPPGTPERSDRAARAARLETEADELRTTAARAEAEANALRAGLKTAGGQALPDDLRRAATAARQDRRSEAQDLLRSAAARLDQWIEALAERPAEAAPELAKKLRSTADDLDALAAAQDELRRKAAAAARNPDPAARAEDLRQLAREQERLQDRGRELLQRLNRDRADAAARDLRAALEQMEAARSDLDSGSPGMRAQNEAVDRLDAARDRLDAATAAAPQQLADERRRKLADAVKALLDRQTSRLAEADRLHGLVARNRGWERDHLVSYGDLAEAEQELAREVRALEPEFAPLPVLARVAAEAAAALDTAATRIAARRDDFDPALAFDPDLEAAHDRRVKRPMELAARRLEQLWQALRPDPPKPTAPRPPEAAPPGPAPTAPGGRPQDLVPPLAQLKLLRTLQAELNERTADFARRHPHAGQLTDEAREELKELEAAQREIAALFEQLARLFGEPDAAPRPPEPSPPEKP